MLEQTRFQRVLGYLKIIAAIVGILFVIGLAILIGVLSPDIIAIVNNFKMASEKLASSAAKLDSTLKEVNQAAVEQRAFLKQQQDLFNNEKTQQSIGLFLRSGKQIDRAIIGLNHTIDLINTETLPRVHTVLTSTDETILAGKGTLAATTTTIKGVDDSRALLTQRLLTTVDAVNKLAADPNLEKIIAGIASDSEQVAELAKKLNVSVEVVNKELPATLADVARATHNTADLMGEVAKVATSINKKPTFAQKLFKYLVTAGILIAQNRP